ncbi:helix-turn-helix transcriptional regulator [Pseudomonas sp. 148P]|uniref:Helix-turn-helix transcriptional regulator n=1 Tax=Pseudomonas ulcerans TaxID=3115852 RepID=A0ABU7HW35_9PSED|nr:MULTISPECIES: helix-turn-helix transcriptional regulator [unclassified Pseudomonas]MEE1922885.1 helix-turn-helix transcriptional regulator [Pseudomonas sp. 147P]MEE1935735.1 helix-turn-helix transcriptional regulator [Pseudomonas sp. 148P]
MNRISQVRAQGGVTQIALAEALKWSQGRLSNYESGRRVPGLAESRAVVAALNSLGVICGLDDVFPPDGAENSE